LITAGRCGTVTLTMFDLVSNMLKELPSDIDGMSATPENFCYE